MLGHANLRANTPDRLSIDLLRGRRQFEADGIGVARRPVSESVQMYGQQIGLVVLLGLMGLAVYNDILRML